MRMFLILFAILIMKSSGAQSSKDTMCLPSSAVQGLLIDAQRKDLLEADIKDLNARIVEKEIQLATTNTRDSLLIVSLGREISIMKDQRGLFEAELKAVTKQIKRERRKTRLVAFAGILTTAAGILFIK